MVYVLSTTGLAALRQRATLVDDVTAAPAPRPTASTSIVRSADEPVRAIYGKAVEPTQPLANPTSAGRELPAAALIVAAAESVPPAAIPVGLFAPSDPLFSAQLHLGAIGRLGVGNFLGLQRIWDNFNGSGVNVGVWDDGIQQTHQDLDGRYNAALHVNVAGVGLNNGLPIGNRAQGTAIAGLIAAEQNNGEGGVGIAFGARVTGVTIFGGGAYDIDTNYANYVASLNALQNFDITNHSYGFSAGTQQFSKLDADRIPGVQASLANGRGGLGTINVAEIGEANHMNGEAWKHHRGVIAVAATTDTGQVTATSSYGPNVLVSAPVGTVTTDLLGADGLNGLADQDFTNISASSGSAAAVTSGVVALMLDANPGLGFRDIQDILAISAIGVGSVYGGATTNENFAWRYNAADNWNGGGMHYSEDYGFGMVNAFQAVRLAETWLLSSPGQVARTLSNEQVAAVTQATIGKAIPNIGVLTHDISLAFAIEMESVNVTVGITHSDFRHLAISLRSPDGTTINLTNRTSGSSTTSDAPYTFTFNAQGFRGESSGGTWRLTIADQGANSTGTLDSLRIETVNRGTFSVTDTYYYTDEILAVLAQPGQAGRINLADTDGGIDWINAAAMHRDLELDLNAGFTSRLAGFSIINIAAGTTIENAIAGDGNDDVTGNGVDNELHGGRGDDRLEGGAGNDKLFGGAGNDELAGGANVDTMRGGTGNDTYLFDNVSDIAAENLGEGVDIVISSVNYTLRPNLENLTLTGVALIGTGNELDNFITGNELANTLVGAAGNDRIDGGGGADVLRGDTGDDRYTFDNAGDIAVDNPGEGTDTILTSVNYTLRPNQENVTLAGAATNAVGNELANIVTGNGLGNLLAGRAGNDILNGGAGIDTFLFDTALGAGNIDRITDFLAVDDVMRLSLALFGAAGAGALSASELRLGTAAVDADDFVIYDSATGRVFYDADGSAAGAQVHFATFDTRPVNITAADFVVV